MDQPATTAPHSVQHDPQPVSSTEHAEGLPAFEMLAGMLAGS